MGLILRVFYSPVNPGRFTVLFEANDEWQTSSRYMMAEAFAQIDKEEIDPILSITTKAA